MANNSIWDEFDKSIDVEKLAQDIEEAEKNGGGNFREVPHGSYEIAVKKLDVTHSRKGDPMFTCWMKIVEGEYRGSMIFMNQVLNQTFQFHIVNDFLTALTAECDASAVPEIKFRSFNQYGNMMMDIMELIDNNFEYNLNYAANPKNPQFSTFTIEEVYPLED